MQVTAHASWFPIALPVFLFCLCISEVISLWPSCWWEPRARPSSPAPRARHWYWAVAGRPGPNPQDTARILRQAAELVSGLGRGSLDTN